MRLAPDDFWRLSVNEWLWLTTTPAAQSLDRTGLETLMQLYPDKDYDIIGTT